ncbi:uncharacterized protein LOC111384865, partial [Olea europaea var. sylvestris]|uniref:uncharacterized protein LOC111384865 n=1 Tax=Olea europaea var. sylvestris TaxID=158386 RepID=UPI000C1D6ED6
FFFFFSPFPISPKQWWFIFLSQTVLEKTVLENQNLKQTLKCSQLIDGQVTLAHLKDKPVQTQSQSSSGLGVSSGVRSAAARLLGGGNGSKALSFVGGNGGSKSVSGVGSRIGSLGASSSNNAVGNYDGKGTYLVFNVGDAIFISDLNSQDKDPIKSIHFGNSNPVCHAFDPDSKDGHDLLIGLNTGDVYSVALRQQLQEVGKKLVGAQHYNKDGSINTRQVLDFVICIVSPKIFMGFTYMHLHIEY